MRFGEKRTETNEDSSFPYFSSFLTIIQRGCWDHLGFVNLINQSFLIPILNYIISTACAKQDGKGLLVE